MSTTAIHFIAFLFLLPTCLGADTLSGGQSLSGGSCLQSNGGGYEACMQTDGNLVVYASGKRPLWASGTTGRSAGPYRMMMQTDNNLVVVDKNNAPLWSAGTFNRGAAPASVTIQSDGNFVVYDRNHAPLWASGTRQASAPSAPSGGGGQFSGDGTHYSVGMGACGKVNNDGELVAALNAPQYGVWANPNAAPVCGRCANVRYNGRSVRVTIMDMCPGCGYGSLDLSPTAFSQLADLGVGRIKITWDWC